MSVEDANSLLQWHKRLKALQWNNSRGRTQRPLSFWVESLNQRVTGGDNCVWAINTIREDKSLVTRPSSPSPASTRSQTDSHHFTAPTKPQGTYFSQTVRQREKREDRVELETQTRARDLLPATVLSLAASLWPWQSRPDRVEPTLTPSHSNAHSDHSSHLASGARLCWTVIAKAQTGKHKNNCPLLWPQQGVGHLDSSEPSAPQKITTMRLRLSQRWGTHLLDRQTDEISCRLTRWL